MEGGRAMEGRGSGVEDWRGEAHLGSSLPVSPRCCPCPLVISRVHVSWPVSAHRCLCPRVVACVHASLPVSMRHCPCCLWSTHRSPCLFTFVGGHFHSWAWVVAFIRGWLSSFGGGCLHSGAVVFVQGRPSSFVGGPSSFVGNGRVWWWGAIGWWW